MFYEVEHSQHERQPVKRQGGGRLNYLSTRAGSHPIWLEHRMRERVIYNNSETVSSSLIGEGVKHMGFMLKEKGSP